MSQKKKLSIDKLNDNEVDPGVLSQITSVSKIFSQFASQVDSMASRLEEVEVKINTLSSTVSALSAQSQGLTLGEFTSPEDQGLIHHYDTSIAEASATSAASSSSSDPEVHMTPLNVETNEVSEATGGTGGTEVTDMSSVAADDTSAVDDGDVGGVSESVDETDDISVVSVQTTPDDEELSSVLTTTPYYNNPIFTCENNECSITFPSDYSHEGCIKVTVEVLNPNKEGYIHLWSPQDKLSLTEGKLFKSISNIKLTGVDVDSSSGFKMMTNPKLLAKGLVICKFNGDSHSHHTLSFMITYTD